ncbi:Type IV conjugative transfer system protein TraV [Thiorhodococcus drewsii AZ1]|uniref:Type IV conjugative transfer system protein TraV n=1 Tax=Thiorhodococcus drewsii AZ1 TaxID=765913 RepID=G2DYR2_9GAMM|nr:TraV family lipoprotein [Thiorhodococcus drewsii]EGV32689.1 Type IV conjugative transfer system protein TraV [Thiorhodococcus drewsii AZ1]
MNRRSLLLLIGALLTASTTSGCGSLALGKGRFSCQGHPSHPMCLPTSSVYALTESSEPIQGLSDDEGRETDWQVRSDAKAGRSDPLVSEPTSLDRFTGEADSEPRARSDHKGQTPPDLDLPDLDAPPRLDAPLEPLPYLADEDLLLPRSTDPLPLRLPAQVMRIWLAPWEDDRGDLHASGYVYTEIVPRTWTLAEGPARFSNALLRPLQSAVRSTPTPRSQP